MIISQNRAANPGASTVDGEPRQDFPGTQNKQDSCILAILTGCRAIQTIFANFFAVNEPHFAVTGKITSFAHLFHEVSFRATFFFFILVVLT